MKTLVEGETTVYGSLISINQERDIAIIRSIDKTKITCNISQEIGKKLKLSLCEKNQRLAFEGLASWNINTWRIESLKVHSFYSLESADLGESLLDFSEQFGKHWIGGSMEEFMEKIK